MPGVQRLLANANNAVPDATVTASSVAPATGTVFRQPTARAGYGRVNLMGGYTGADDATLAVEIRSASGTAARVSQPVFAGAGNGTMTPPTATTGTASQTVTVTLTDLGTVTTAAQAVIYGDVLVRAHTAGAAGNALRLTVTPALTRSSAPVGALSSALKKDTAEWTDQQQDFGSVPLNPDGTVPSTAPRLLFGGDESRIYRHYKRWDGTQWQYGVSPQLAADYAAGSTVHTVTGTYALTVTDGVTPATATVTTLYEALVALDAMTLVDVVGIIANDRKPGGAGAMDVPLRTAAFALPVLVSAPERMPDLQSLTVAAVAPTETVTLKCTANTPVGAETWAVQSKVSGPLPPATTGVLYTDSPYVGFKIPVAAVTTLPITGTITITARSFPRDPTSSLGIPDICLDRPLLGSSAHNQTLRLVWTARPPADCDCLTAAVSGHPDSVCLGITIDEGGTVGTLITGYQTRLDTLYTWRSGFVTSNTDVTSAGELRSAQNDLDLAERATGLLAGCLGELYTDSTTPSSGALSAWDAAMTALEDDLTPLFNLGAEGAAPAPVTATAIAADTAYVIGDRCWVKVGVWDQNYGFVQSSSRLYRCVLAGTTGTPSYGDHASGLYVQWGTTVFDVVADTEPGPGVGAGSNTDINATGTLTSDPGISRDPETFASRYAARMDVVRVKAGIVPKSDAGAAGSACWRDPGDPFYWQVEGTEYLPVFNNRYYHSVVEWYNPVTKRNEILPTHEFGFGLRVACAERLQVGDSLTITINSVATNTPYHLDDTYAIPLVAGGPLAFSGGVTGTDALTWAVKSSTAGALSDYTLHTPETAYSASGFTFTIHRGGLAFALGDAFVFSVETGGRFRWRKDAGPWSGDTAIADTVSLAEGLNAAFVDGATPSLVAGDVYSFTVRQPYAPRHVQSAHGESWSWTGSTATLTLTWTADQTVTTVGVLRHGLASPATVTILLKNVGGATLDTLTLPVRSGPLVMPLPVARTTVRILEMTVASASGMTLGWVYAGVPFQTAHNAQCTLRRSYALDRGSARNARAAYLGSGRGGVLAWEHWLLPAEFDDLLALVDACKADSDAPLVLMPHALHPDDVALVRIDSEALEISDVLEYQTNDASRRRLSLTLPLAPVYA